MQAHSVPRVCENPISSYLCLALKATNRLTIPMLKLKRRDRKKITVSKITAHSQRKDCKQCRLRPQEVQFSPNDKSLTKLALPLLHYTALYSESDLNINIMCLYTCCCWFPWQQFLILEFKWHICCMYVGYE